MKTNNTTENKTRKNYQVPAMAIVLLDSTPLLNTVSGSDSFDISFGGDGDGEIGD
jgi:hypothetical protein